MRRLALIRRSRIRASGTGMACLYLYERIEVPSHLGVSSKWIDRTRPKAVV